MQPKIEKQYLKAKDVAILCNVGLNRAYDIIRDANAAAAKAGKYVIPHRVNRKFLFAFLGLE